MALGKQQGCISSINQENIILILFSLWREKEKVWDKDRWKRDKRKQLDRQKESETESESGVCVYVYVCHLGGMGCVWGGYDRSI